MAETKDPREDPVARFLVERFAPEGAAAAACPDDNLLAGYAGGTLLDGEREAVEVHVAACASCRTLVARLAGEAAPAPAPPRIPLAFKVAAIAAALLVAFFLFWPRTREPGTAEHMASAARELARERPGLFEGFDPMRPPDPPNRVTRGGLTILHPTDRILEDRPTFRWEPVPGVDAFEVALFAADGRELWREDATGTSLDYPAGRDPLQPGARYVWEVSYRTGPFGDDASTRGFVVADGKERAAWDEAMREIERRAPERAVRLLQAHYGIQKRFLAEAEKAARAFRAKYPGDPMGRETLVRVLEWLGASEANGLQEEGG